MSGRPGLVVRVATTLLLASAVAVWLDASGTLSGFSAAKTQNSTDTAATASASFTHTYGSSTCSASQRDSALVGCAGSLYPAAIPAANTSSQTDTVQNTGTSPASQITAQADVASCGPVSLANAFSAGASGAMLPRTGSVFQPSTGPMSNSGSMDFNGSTGYASSVGSSTEPVGPTTGTATMTFGYGLWFRTSSTATQILFGFSSNALMGSGNSDRELALQNGKLSFVATTNGTSTTAAAATGVTTYADGAWHFAYVSIAATRTAYKTSIEVDGKSVLNNASTNGTLSATTGYWHIGGIWYSSSTAGSSRNIYFDGELSDFIVDESGTAPNAVPSSGSPPANPTSYTTFDATRTQQWYLNDSGGSFDGTTTSGTLPAGTTLPSSTANPCTYIDIAWSVSNPAGTVLANQTFAAAATAAASTVPAPEPGTSQTSTVTVKRDATAPPAYAQGLIIYAPVLWTFTVGSSSWTARFAWNAPAAGTATGSTFVIS